MTTEFQCPECHAVHAAPLSAAFVLAVRCEECELALALAESRSPAALLLAA
jgi:hypothetical protein